MREQGKRFPSGVYLVRHGKTALNKGAGGDDRIRGWQDVPLDKTGKEQAREMVKVGRLIGFAHVFSSDFQRAAEVGKHLAKGADCPINLSYDLRPWHLGDWQGKNAKDVQPELERFAEKDPEKPVPGGESFKSFAERFIPALSTILNSYLHHFRPLAVVTHFRCVKLAEAWIDDGEAGIDFKTFFADDMPVGGMVRVFPDDKDQWSFERITIPESVAPALAE